MSNEDTILVHTADETITRRGGGGVTELKVGVLAENVKLFLSQIESILEGTPEEVGNFRFTEIVVSAEVSGSGKLALFGSGIEGGAKGGLTFKFQKKL